MVSSASVTLAGCSGASPNRTATARCNRCSASRYGANSGNCFKRARQVNQVGFAGVVQQTPERIPRGTELADVDGMFGNRVELRGVAAKPTLIDRKSTRLNSSHLG